MTTLRFAAAGDSFITRSMPVGDPALQQVAQIIKQADVRFNNLEVVLRKPHEGFPAAEGGGTWAAADPAVLDTLRWYGFNLIAWANNHTLDYSVGGLESTTRYLDAAGLVHAGVGQDLTDAGSVKYLDTPAGKVGLIAAVSTCPASWIAGESRADCAGRPGVNPLRFKTVFRIPPDEMQRLRELANACHINARRNMSINEGFTPADDSSLVRFGEHLFEAIPPGGQPGMMTSPHTRDMQRIEAAIAEARQQAAAVVVSIHAHEMKDDRKDQPADFLVTFARRCIDAGAHAIIGHGPHILRGIEIYKGCPIFYSLGNFVFQNETVGYLPMDFYEKFGLGHEHNVTQALAKRTDNDTRGIVKNSHAWLSVIATWQMEQGRLREITLHPIALGFGKPREVRGSPSLTTDMAELEHLRELSAAMGTRLQLADGVARWTAEQA